MSIEQQSNGEKAEVKKGGDEMTKPSPPAGHGQSNRGGSWPRSQDPSRVTPPLPERLRLAPLMDAGAGHQESRGPISEQQSPAIRP